MMENLELEDKREGVIGQLHSVESFGSLDGPGIRYVLFLQGCALRCQYCHNPDTWERKGKEIYSEQILADIKKYLNFISTGGVTLSGGEPLLQPDFCEAIIDGCHRMGLHTAVDTAGSVPLELSRAVIDKADLLLLDIKALDSALHRKITQADNHNTLETLSYCEHVEKPVWIRHVVVPGLTLDDSRLDRLAGYLCDFSCVKKVELLPFHQMGAYKWEYIRVPYQLKDTPETTKEEIDGVKSLFRAKGLPV